MKKVKELEVVNDMSATADTLKEVLNSTVLPLVRKLNQQAESLGSEPSYNFASEMMQKYLPLMPDARRVFLADGDLFYGTDVMLPYIYENECFYAQRIKVDGTIYDSKIYLINHSFEYSIGEEGECEYEGDWYEVDSIEDWDPKLHNIIRSFTKKEKFSGNGEVYSTTYYLLTEANTLRVETLYARDKLTEAEFFSKKGLTLKGGDK